MYSKLANIVLSNFPIQRDEFNDVFEMFVTAISDTIEKYAPLTRLSGKQARLCKEALDYKKASLLQSKKRTQCFAAISSMVT